MICPKEMPGWKVVFRAGIRWIREESLADSDDLKPWGDYSLGLEEKKELNKKKTWFGARLKELQH